MFQLTVLWHRCRGCPYCVEAAPQLFKIANTPQGPKAVAASTDGPVAVLPLTSLHDVLRAQQACPAGGIVIRPIRPWLPNIYNYT